MHNKYLIQLTTHISQLTLIKYRIEQRTEKRKHKAFKYIVSGKKTYYSGGMQNILLKQLFNLLAVAFFRLHKFFSILNGIFNRYIFLANKSNYRHRLNRFRIGYIIYGYEICRKGSRKRKYVSYYCFFESELVLKLNNFDKM